MLDRLEGMGYIRRQRCEKDRRKILIKRTSKDKNIETEYVKLSQEHTKLFFHGFSEEQIDCFEENLKRILSNLTEFESKAD
jgi:DNA-binding MarR family transcriptional regulator